MAQPKKSLSERILEADMRGGMYLGNANEAEERGDHTKAAKLFDKAQFWLDRYNLLTGQGDKRGPSR